MLGRWIACAALAVLSACAAGRRSPVAGRGSSDACAPVRVMTWNIAAGHGDLGNVAETLRDLKPDVIALQEVDVRWSERSAFVDQADSLGKFLKMNVRFGPIYDFAPRQFGVAILSRYPIVSSINHEISRLSTQQQNPVPAKAPGFLEAVIDVAGTRVRVFSTHLDYRPDPSVRERQVNEMLDVIHGSSVPIILAGDMNAPPPSNELAPLFKSLVTLSTDMTYPAESPTKRIDYIFVSNDVPMADATVPATLASDHRPVVMTLIPCRR
jgi:endonuclease/exonuclease/phosphatase family metal-dependent hydrolase